MKRALWLAALLLVPAAAFAAGPVEATAKAMKAKIKIGDELRFHVQVTHPRKYTLEPLDKPSFGAFELKKASPPVKRGQNRVTETFGYTLTAFEIGDFEIPPVKVSYRNESGELDQVSTEAVKVKVVSVGKKLTDKDDIRAIKGPASASMVRFRNGLFASLAALLAAAFVFLVARRVIRERKEAESRKPAHERVKIELARLKEQGLLEDKHYREYYAGLSDILRRYIERAMGIEALERTTSELAAEMNRKGIAPQVVNDVRAVLSESDLVKFAKLEPEHALAGRLETTLGAIVEATRPQPKEKKR
jgi:hypothetical protein